MTQEPKNANKSHIVIYAILGVVILGMALLCLQLYTQANAPQRTVTVVQQVPVSVPYPADEAGIKAAIARETEKLAVKQPDAKDFTYQKALDTRAAIKKGDYAAAKAIAQDMLARSKIRNWDFYPFNMYMWKLSDLNDPSYINHLNAWADAEKNQTIPLLIRAQYYFDAGWHARGTSFAHGISGTHMDSFADSLSAAISDAEKAIELDKSNPLAYYFKLNAVGSYGYSSALRQAFQESIAQHPTYYKLYSAMLDKLTPKWGGSLEAMEDFVEEYAGHASEHSPLKMLYLEQYRYLINVAYLACYKQEGEAEKQCVETYMSRLASPALEKKIAGVFDLYNFTNKYEFEREIYRIIQDIATTRGTDKFSSALLQLAANAMGVQIQLKGNNPGHNNYVLDQLTGLIWLRNRDFADAEIKYKEALLDINNTTFPDDEAKAEALAGIYSDMAGLYSSMGNAANHIAYLDASFVASGGLDKGKKIGQCEAYDDLKMAQKTIDVCTEVYQANGAYEALWWRARGYRALHKTDEAIADLSVIADSEHGYRTSAVILISIIYGDLKDHEKMRDVLNKYEYPYDVDQSAKRDISTAYNNRCYAYMQLGELEKALADCTESLKYGSMPDTYQKQQKLISMLKEKGK